MGKRGVVGELLVVVALLASVFILVSTFSDIGDVPNVPKESLDALRDTKTLLSQALLSWLQEGVTDEPLMCNGLYPVNESIMISSLQPYIDERLDAAVPTDASLSVIAGELSGISFEESALRITLANGSVIYDDGTVYSEDLFDKEYLFNVRLMLALGIVQDWARCDAGNLSEKLQDQFGRACFFGKKNPDYGDASGNSCSGETYRVTEADRDYMLRQAVTTEQVAAAAGLAVDELNSYFAGEASCKQPVLADDTGITCSYALEEVEFDYLMAPWSSDEIVIARELDYIAFNENDEHVHAVAPSVYSYTYRDEQLGCMDDPMREPVTPSVSTIEYALSNKYIDVKTGDVSAIYANPILYINTSRGARFTLVVTCEDTRASLLGQPLEYTFALRHGIRQHCGPPESKSAMHRCGACNPMAATDLSHCIQPQKLSCDLYYSRCSEAIVWEYLRENGIENADYRTIVAGSQELKERINESCETVYGFEDEYPVPLPDPNDPEYEPCVPAHRTVCCMAPGLNLDRLHCGDINDPECFFGKQDIRNLCYGGSSCGAFECHETSCNAGTDWKCTEGTPKPAGTPCKENSGCFTCQEGSEGMACGFDDAKLGDACTLGSNYDSMCTQFTCQNDGSFSGCLRADAQNEGVSCEVERPRDDKNICMTYICQTGVCGPQPANDGMDCGPIEEIGDTETCTYNAVCSGGACRPTTEISCTPRGGTGCGKANEEDC